MATTDVNDALDEGMRSSQQPHDAPTQATSAATDERGDIPRSAAVVCALALASVVTGLDLAVTPSAWILGTDALRAPGPTSAATIAYLIASLVAIPIVGRLGDTIGRKGLFQISAVVFAAGSGLTTWAHTTGDLAGYRTLQGAGVGGLMVGVVAIAGDLAAVRRRTIATALVLATFVVSYASGRPLAGILDDRSWRWFAYGEIVLTGLALVLASLPMRRTAPARSNAPASTPRGFDLLGALLLGGIAAGLVVTSQQLRTGAGHAWHSAETLAPAAATLVAGLLFVIVQRWVSVPILPLRLLRDRTFGIATVVGAVAGAAVLGAIGSTAATLGLDSDATHTHQAIRLLPLAGGVLVAGVFAASMLCRSGHTRVLAALGALAGAVGLGGLSLLEVGSRVWLDVLALAGLGVGAGLLLPTLVVAAQSATDRADGGIASTVSVYVRQLGIALVIAGFGTATPVGSLPRGLLAGIPLLALAAVLVLLLRERSLTSGSPRDSDVPTEHSAIPFPGQQVREGFGWQPSAGIDTHDEVSAATTAKPGSRFDPTAHLDDADHETVSRYEIRARVRQSDGRPVPGVVLTLCDLAGHELGRSVALGDGRYALVAPDTGAFLLLASVPGYHPQAQVVDLRTSCAEVEFDLHGESGTYGVVRSGTGDPVSGATVALADSLGEIVASASTAADGSYDLIDLRPGAYTLAVNALGYRPAARALRIPDVGRIQQDVELVGGGHLHGTVRGGAGNPLRDARIALVDSWGRVARVTASGPSGHYRFAEVAEGDYTVVAAMYPPAASRVRVNGGQQHQHDVELTYPDV